MPQHPWVSGLCPGLPLQLSHDMMRVGLVPEFRTKDKKKRVCVEGLDQASVAHAHGVRHLITMRA